MWIDEVSEIMRETAESVIMPRFRALATADIIEKAAGDVVTVADYEAEEIITARLRGLLDVPVVGEEAAAADPRLTAALHEAPAAWVVDPVDGTANFVAGRREFAIMVALVRGGETVASWILQPATGRNYVAERGSGAWRDGARLQRAPAPSDASDLRGVALTKYLDPPTRHRVEARTHRFAAVDAGAYCAGVDYPRLVEAATDFALFHRTLPWDHAPGTLLVSEAGGVALRLDRTRYLPTDTGQGLLVAADAECWETVDRLLLAP